MLLSGLTSRSTGPPPARGRSAWFVRRHGTTDRRSLSVSVNDREVAYFQHIADDKTQLGSNVICVFARRYSGEPMKRVGALIGDRRKAEIGMVINPYSILCRIRTGSYDFAYPGYE